MCTCRLRTQKETFIFTYKHTCICTYAYGGHTWICNCSLIVCFSYTRFLIHSGEFLLSRYPLSHSFSVCFFFFNSLSRFSIHSTVLFFFSFLHSFYCIFFFISSFFFLTLYCIAFIYSLPLLSYTFYCFPQFFPFLFHSLSLSISLISSLFSYFVILPLCIPNSAVFSSLYIILSLIVLHFSHFLILSHSVSLPNRRRGDGGHAASQSSPADGRRALGSCGAPSCNFLHRLLRFHLFFPSFALVLSCLNEVGRGGGMKEDER